MANEEAAHVTMADKAIRCCAQLDLNQAPTLANSDDHISAPSSTAASPGGNTITPSAPYWTVDDLKMLGRSCGLTDEEMAAMDDHGSVHQPMVDQLD